VKTKEAQVAVSAGNTGALMAMSMFLLGTLEGISRPAIAALWPTKRGQSVVLDVGANVVVSAEQLVDFAVMGQAFARAILGLERPTVGILNVGSEDAKGNDAVKGAAHILRANSALPIEFAGFVEGDDISEGTVDVVVTDGFTGNVALKTAEGLARFFRRELRTTFTSGWSARLGAAIAMRALGRMRQRLDPSGINGGPFLGLNGIIVKSHGGTDARGFATAIRLAADLAKSDFSADIERNLNRLAAGSLGAHREGAVV
jgi:glycerol-3-phosphate acyltransferase PlsX